MELLAEAMDGQTVDKRPPLSDWSPEVEATTQVADLLKSLIAVTIMVNAKAGAKKPDYEPSPRPGTVLADVQRERRRRKHRELVALVNRQRGEGTAE